VITDTVAAKGCISLVKMESIRESGTEVRKGGYFIIHSKIIFCAFDNLLFNNTGFIL
jgi:hypothetical protein